MLNKLLGFFLALFLSSTLFFPVEVSAGGSQDVEQFPLSLVAGVEQVIEPSFGFRAFALSHVEDVEVRFLQQGIWTPWQSLLYEEEGLEGSELLFVSSSQAFALRSEVSVDVQAMILRIEDTFSTVSLTPIQVGEESGQIISRRQWGADESLGLYDPDKDTSTDDDSDELPENICEPIEQAYPGQFQQQSRKAILDAFGRQLLWPREYSKKVKKIVVHHTARSLKDLNDDNRIDSRDYRLAVQAVYRFHTVSRGWGDIGYHYLIDPDGRIYEGRAGGKGVIGAHVLCQNTGTVGVAVLGDFNQQPVVNGNYNGLAKAIRYVADLYTISPLGKSSFRGAVIPHIVTHAELGEVTREHIGRGGTQCPGHSLKLVMSQLRTVVADGFTPEYGFELVEDIPKVQLKPLEEKLLTVNVKNTGSETWRRLQVVPIQGRRRIRRLDPVLELDQLAVRSHQSYTFQIPLQAGLQMKRETLSFQLVLDGQPIDRSIQVSTVTERPVFRYELAYLDQGEDVLLYGEERLVVVRLKNTSNFPWLPEGPHAVSLREVKRRGAGAVVVRKGIEVPFAQVVPVGGEVDFEVPLLVQRGLRTLRKDLLPIVGRSQGLKGRKLRIDLAVEPPRFAARVRPFERRTVLEKGFQEEVLFEIENTGNFDWFPGMVWYQLGRNAEKISIEHFIERGETFVFPVSVQPGYGSSEVLLKGFVGVDSLSDFIDYKPFRKAKASFQERLKTKGRVQLAFEKVGQSDGLLPTETGEYAAWVEYRNTGTVPWYREGRERTVLAVQGKPEFVHRSWEKRKIAGFLSQAVVMPGEIGRFDLQLQIKQVPSRVVRDDFVPFVSGQRMKVRGGRARFELRAGEGGRAESSQPGVVQSGTNEELPPLRVLLTEIDQEALEISSPQRFTVWDSRSNPTRTFQSGEVFQVTADDVKAGKVFRVLARSNTYLEFQNWHRIKRFGSKTYNDNRFRGELEIRWHEGRMIVINILSLSDYMKGIAEQPETADIPQEKRKVIAVLARSYALHYLISGYQKFPGKPYNAADSAAIFQKYLGYGFEARSPKWQQALTQTAGEVLFVEGSDHVLRAAYFSCTDGDRTKSASEVWGGQEYYQRFASVFQSVSDSLGDDPNREGFVQCGHQVGLSGYGATQLAKQGKNYREIIQYYYQGVRVRQYDDSV